MITTRESSGIAGVRPLHASDILFVDVPVDVSPVSIGDWLVVRHQDVDVLGCVVIAPEQLVSIDVPDEIPAFVRRATELDLSGAGDAGNGPPTSMTIVSNSEAPAHSFLTIPDPPRNPARTIDTGAIKAGFPRLGTIFVTPAGEGMVVGVNTTKMTITIKIEWRVRSQVLRCRGSPVTASLLN